MSIAEEPYSPPQPPAPRDAPTPADATALASYLGLHPVRDAKLMWIAEAAAAEPLPEGWSEVVDPGGRLYYSNGVTGESSRVHPRDEEFRLLVMRSKLEQMHSAPAAQPSAGDWSTIRMKSLEQSLSSAASAPVRALVQRSADRRGGAPRLSFEMLLDEDTRLPWMEAVLREGPRGAAFELLLEGGAAEKSEHLVRLSGPSSSVLVRRERRDAPLPEDEPAPHTLTQKLGVWPKEVRRTLKRRPTLTPFLLGVERPVPLLIVVPGGGYARLSLKEGRPVCGWANSLGFHAALLQYRVLRRHPAPLLDARRAVQLVRRSALQATSYELRVTS